MVWENLKKDLIFTNVDASDIEDVFELAGGELIKQGYCKDSYVEALKEREKEFPTGIDMGGIGVAIPHTDVSHVNKKGMALCILNHPIIVHDMGDEDEVLEAQIVFMLASDEKGHLELLQAILAVLQDQKVLKQLINAKETEEIIEIIKEKENH